MTPEEKAKDLKDRFKDVLTDLRIHEAQGNKNASRYAIEFMCEIFIDEILDRDTIMLDEEEWTFWQQVKTEIEKL